MNIKHNTRAVAGLTFPELQVGEVYLSLSRATSKPRAYLACCMPGHLRAGSAPDFLVNLETGCSVQPSHQILYKHLPDATLDTGK